MAKGCMTAKTSSKEEWKVQGLKFFRKKFLDQAIKCFEYADEQLLVAKCLAFKQAEKGNSMMTDADSKLWNCKTRQTMDKSKKKALKK